MTTPRFLLKGGLMAILALCAACSSSSSPEPEPEAKEIKAKDSALSTEAPEAELVAIGKKLYEARMYSVARDSFQSLKDRYPLGAYATFADIKVADSYFYNGEYNEAAKFYEGFLKSYPGSSDAPYVELQAARSHIHSSRGTGRDRQPLERALTILDGIVERYPGSAYAQTAERERAPVIQQLIEYDKLIITFYQKRGNPLAVEAREKEFSERWGMRLTQASVETAPPEKPLKSLPPLVSSLSALIPAPEKGPTIPSEQPAHLREDPSISSLSASDYTQVQQVECHPSGTPPYGIIEMNRVPKALAAPNFLAYQEPTNGAVVLSELGLRASQKAFNCFGTQDVEITEVGDLRILTTSPVELSTLESPPRLLITSVASLSRTE